MFSLKIGMAIKLTAEYMVENFADIIWKAPLKKYLSFYTLLIVKILSKKISVLYKIKKWKITKFCVHKAH